MGTACKQLARPHRLASWNYYFHSLSAVKMDLLSTYGSNESSSEDSELLREPLGKKDVRSVYLLTYSQANLDLFPSREEFALAVIRSFSNGNAKIIHWCCCREKHQNSGEHYHLALKLDRNQRWLSSKELLQHEYGITVNYSSRHHNYYSAWKYVTKTDNNYLESGDHPDLKNSHEPRTSSASRARRSSKRSRKGNGCRDGDDQGSEEDIEDAEQMTSKKTRKKKRLSAFEVSEIIVEKKLKSLVELQALAYEQKKEGKTDLAEFLVNRTPRAVADVLTSAWEIENSQSKLARSKKTRIELLQDARETECVEGCNGKWQICAAEILANNSVPLQVFRDAVCDLLIKGRGKNRNIMITGNANCGKTFLLKPLTLIYETFCNPASGSFAWVGVQDAECIFLNDFRWSQAVIPWNDFLVMLEGDIVHLPAPKTHFARDISLTSDTPIFCTGKHRLMYIKNGIVDERECCMMDCRWLEFHFTYQIPREQQREIPSCPKCFAELVMPSET